MTGNNEMPNGVHFRRRISVAKVGIYAKNEACDVYPFPLELLRTMASNVYATSFDPLLALWIAVRFLKAGLDLWSGLY